MKARLVLAVALAALVAGGLINSAVGAQGGIRLLLPFSGTRRLTSYVDHRSPYQHDGNVYVYTGEERLTCVDCGQSWTNQGPYCYDGHDGTDYSLYEEPVLAAAPGKVVARWYRGANYGYTIRIDHGNGYETWYSHLMSYSVDLDDQVVAGQQIGISGNSGVSQPYHLHFEVRHNGDVTDPFGWRGSSQDPLAGGAVCLWGDGQCSEIVVEDESAGFAKSGTGWNWDCHGNSWTMRWVTNRNTAQNAYATWRPPSPSSGPFAIEVFVAAVHHSTTKAKYQVYDTDGYHDMTIDQHYQDDEWVPLGTFEFRGDGLDNVYLNNATTESDGSTEVCFDTIKFRQFRVFLPVILSNYSQ